MITRLILLFTISLGLIICYSEVSGQILKYDTKINVSPNGRKTVQVYYLIQINNKESNWLSEVEIYHNPKEKFIFNYANILDRTGEIVRKLKKKEIETRNTRAYFSFYEDDLVSEFDLYWNTYPYQIEYSYTIEVQEFITLDVWSPYVYSDVSTIESSLEVSTPIDYPLNIKEVNGPFDKSETSSESLKSMRWSYTNYKPHDPEIYAPHIMDLIPLVYVYPQEFTYGVDGSLKNWANFGLWQDELNRGTDELPFSEKTIVDKLIVGTDDQKEIVKILYHYLQDQTTYVNVSIDVGGLKSYPASYVCTNKYGDCKALTTYMKALLKYVGIESFYSTVYASESNREFMTDLVGPQANHVILAIPMEKDTIWLENTSTLTPFNYLGESTHNRYTLSVAGEHSRLTRTPILDTADVVNIRNYHFKQLENNIWNSNIALKLKAKQMMKFRYLESSGDNDRLIQFFKEHINLEDFKLGEWTKTDFHRDSLYNHIDFVGQTKSVIRRIGKWQVINPLQIHLPDFEAPNQRKLEVNLSVPIHEINNNHYEFIALDAINIQLPEELDINNEYGSYKTSFNVENNQIMTSEKLIIYSNQIPRSQYPDFYQFINQIKTYQKNSAIIIKP